jgi:hypothetical protein
MGFNDATGHLRDLYRTAMRLEVEFFNAAASAIAGPQLGVLVLDFDETLTVTDSTSVIISTAIQEAVKTEGMSPSPHDDTGM